MMKWIQESSVVRILILTAFLFPMFFFGWLNAERFSGRVTSAEELTEKACQNGEIMAGVPVWSTRGSFEILQTQCVKQGEPLPEGLVELDIDMWKDNLPARRRPVAFAP